MLPEITSSVELVANERLNRDAVGWSRRPLHTSRKLKRPGRTKRWEYWGVITDEFVVGMTLADLSYGHLIHVYSFDRTRSTEKIFSKIGLGPMRQSLSDELPPMTAEGGPISFVDDESGTRLRVQALDIDIDLHADIGGEALGVVVPWSDTRFQYTLKDLNRPVSGNITIAGHSEDVAAGFAVLDRGRGIWPYSMTWNWGTGNGRVDGVELGLQVGGKWTDGTGSTENGLFVNGTLHYWPDELTWEYDLNNPHSPWRVTGPQVDAVLQPFHRRRDVTNVGVIKSSTYQAFGTWTGWATDNDGNRYSLDGLLGWAEEADNRW